VPEDGTDRLSGAEDRQGTRGSALQAETARAIVQWAVENCLVPGDRLREQHLGSVLALSRSPVRRALALLAHHSITEARPGRGYVLLLAGTALEERLAHLPGSDADDFYRRIASDWFEGRIPEQVSTAELQRRYGGPDRDVNRALCRLADDDVIVKQAGKGWRLGPNLASRGDFFDSYRYRQVIEPESILLDSFVLNLPLASLVRTRHERLLSAAAPSVKEMVDADLEFHHLVGVSSGNRFFAGAIARQNTLRRLTEILTAPDSARLKASCVEHLEILGALDSRDAARAADLMRVHLSLSQLFTPKWLGAP